MPLNDRNNLLHDLTGREHDFVTPSFDVTDRGYRFDDPDLEEVRHLMGLDNAQSDASLKSILMAAYSFRGTFLLPLPSTYTPHMLKRVLDTLQGRLSEVRDVYQSKTGIPGKLTWSFYYSFPGNSNRNVEVEGGTRVMYYDEGAQEWVLTGMDSVPGDYNMIPATTPASSERVFGYMTGKSQIFDSDSGPLEIMDGSSLLVPPDDQELEVTTSVSGTPELMLGMFHEPTAYNYEEVYASLENSPSWWRIKSKMNLEGITTSGWRSIDAIGFAAVLIYLYIERYGRIR